MCAVPNMVVFSRSLISCFPGILLRYCLSDFEMVPVATIIIIIIIIIITTAICFHISRIYINIVLVFALLCTSGIVLLFVFNSDILLTLTAVFFFPLFHSLVLLLFVLIVFAGRLLVRGLSL